MKNIYIYLVILFGYNQILLSQAKLPVCNKVKYGILRENVKNSTSHSYYTMYFTPQKSLYLEDTAIVKKNPKQENEPSEKEGNRMMRESIKKKESVTRTITTTNVIYRTDTTKEFIFNKQDANIYSLEIKPPDIKFFYKDSANFKWKIKNDTKKIGQYLCQKAETFFRGRRHIVWFAAELPYPYGPWKFKGLPGMILESHTVGYARIVSKSFSFAINDKECSFERADKYLNNGEEVLSYRQRLRKIYEHERKISEEKGRKDMQNTVPRWLSAFVTYKHDYIYKEDGFEKFDNSFFEDPEEE